jgi:hypothetical protein
MPPRRGEKKRKRYVQRARQRPMMPCISRYSMPARIYLLFFSFALCTANALAQGKPSAPARTPTPDPASLPAHDSHQGLVIAADPYVSAERYKDKFGKHSPYDTGLIAIDLLFRNDNDLPVRVNLKTIQILVRPPGGSRQQLDPLSPEDVADRVLAKRPKDPTPRFPIPRIGAPRSPEHRFAPPSCHDARLRLLRYRRAL